MAEYIDKAVAIGIMRAKADMGVCSDYAVCFYNAARMLELLPAADVAPVRYGRWEDTEGEFLIRCSECNEDFANWEDNCARTHYCPNCGALMDGGVNNAAD